MIFNLSESEKLEAGERYKEDEKSCCKIFVEGMNVEGVKVDKVIMLGKKEENKNRLLLVKLVEVDDRKEILKRIALLRYSEAYGRVYIGRDMSREERLRDRQLREELREKRIREDGSHFMIRRGKVIETGRREEEGGAWRGTGARPKNWRGRGNFWEGEGRGNYRGGRDWRGRY